MANSSEQWVAASQAAVDSVYSAFGISLSGFEKLAAHTLSGARNGLLEQLEFSRQLLGVKDPQEAFALQRGHAQPQIEKAVAYLRGLYDISTETQEAFAKLLEARQAELLQTLGSALDGYGKSAGNAELAVAAVKSAISAANSAFENAHKAARQVADITEAGVAAAASATVRAVGAGSPAPAARKKAA